MALGKYNRRTVSATSGAIVPGATVSFYNQLTGLPATAYNDPDGLDPIGSSTTSGSLGELEVFLEPGRYRITVEKDDLYEEITYEPVTGDIALIDAEEVGLNFLTVATPADSSIPRILPNGFTELRTVAQTKIDLSLNNVDNTSDVDKPVSTATQAALDLKSDLTDPRFTDSREWTATTVDQAEAEAGVSTTRRAWTAERVRQAIVAWWLTIGTTVGKAILNLTNPSAIRFIRINADNSVTARSDSEMRTDLGLGTAALATLTTTLLSTTAGRVVKVGDYGLGVGAGVTSTPDYNTLTVPGNYLLTGTGATNGPAAAAFSMIVLAGTISTTNDRVTQIAVRLSSPYDMFVRQYVGSWTAWVAVYMGGATDVPVTDGGTGSSTASGARTNLGLNVTVPSGPTASGETGQTAGDANYIYRCIATDTWIRVPKDATWV